MKKNKTYTIILLWILHFYIFYGLTSLYFLYETDSLQARFYDFKSTIEFFILVPIGSIFFGIYYTIFLSIILMIVLIENKKYKMFKSYLISITFFYTSYFVLFYTKNSFNNYNWLVTLIALIIAGTIIKLVFSKTFKRLDSKYNLH